MGERSGIDFKYVGAVERGEANFTIAVLERLARALGVEPFELLRPLPGAEDGARGRPKRARGGAADLYSLLAELDAESASFVRDVVASYIAHRRPRGGRGRRGGG